MAAGRRGGMEVGAHTRTHPRLTQCDDTRMHNEIGGSKRELEDRLGIPISQFCYPYGDVDERTAHAVRQAGFAAATTTHRGRAMAGTDPWRLPRIQVARHYLLPQFAMKAFPAYEDRRG